MGIFSKIRNKEIRNEVAETTETVQNPVTLNELNSFFNSTDINSKALNSSTYYACMQVRCNAISKLPIEVMQKTNKGRIKAKDNELYSLLKRRPNPFMTPHDFLWATEFQRLEYGNAFWVMDIRGGRRKGLYLLDSTRVTVVKDDVGLLTEPNAVFYVYEDRKKGTLIYTSDEILHFKNFSINGIDGTSVKKYLFDMISNEVYSTKVLKEKYQSGLQNPITVQYSGDLNDAIQEKIKAKFRSLGGIKQSGQVIPIPTEFKVEQLSTSLVDNQFFELNGLNSLQIANAFGVKSFQLNNFEKGSQNSPEQQNKVFYSDTMNNVFLVYEQEISYKALTEDEQLKKDMYIRFNVDAMLKGDIEARTKSYVEGINNGYMMISEVREKEDLPHIEGTDILIIGNGASIPLDQLGDQYSKGGGKD